MSKYLLFSKTMGILSLLTFAMACSPTPSNLSDQGQRTLLGPDSDEIYSENPYNFKVLLTDHPLDEVEKVIVNISRMEFFLRGGDNNRARLLMGDELGYLDLLTLRDGVMLPVDEARIPNGVEIHQIRLVLHNYGNHLVNKDSSLCNLKTPSGQTSGIKIILSEPIVIEPNYSYSLLVDFDAKKSIVLQGNGGCLLKPVIKVKNLSKSPLAPENGQPPGGEEVILVDDGESNLPDNDGYEDGNDYPGDWGPIINDDEMQRFF